ncbi:MAG: DNA primase, partial [Ottowia sp.]|nr:DNA primase [Ottowia sp.]
MPIPQHFIDDLLARADIVDIISRHVQLKKAGANFLGLCPFHSEKTPSFNVNPARQFFHCFGCGKGGNAITFLMEHTGATFREAVEDLAQQCGLAVPEDDRSPQERQRAAEQRQHQDTLADVLQRAARAWRRQLKDAPHAIDYLKRRGLSGEIAARYGLGYAHPRWQALASVFPDYASPLLEESGLVIATEDGKRYDRFRDRITFPIRSLKGQVIGFGARTMGDE